MNHRSATKIMLGVLSLALSAQGASPRGRYTVAANSVTDATTHLMWQRGFAPTLLTWEDGKAYCLNLVLDGQTDWRMPSITELVTLVDVRESPAAFDRSAFPAAINDGIWSATPAVWDPAQAWLVGPNGSSSPDDITITFYVRCVRNG